MYKLAAVENSGGDIIPKIKISENVEKITVPHFKKLYRLYDRKYGRAIADYVCVHDETIDETKPLEIFDPNATWKRRTLTNYVPRELMCRIFKNGECVYERPTLEQIKSYCAGQMDTLWDEVKRFDNPHHYYVDLSQRLWDIQYELLKNGSHGSREG